MRWALVLVLAALTAGCGSTNVERRLQTFREHRARELIAEYSQARLNGDLLTMCVKSNLVSGLYRDARDEGSAQAWAARNAADCRAARDAYAPMTADR